jgi:hypothetical protein
MIDAALFSDLKTDRDLRDKTKKKATQEGRKRPTKRPSAALTSTPEKKLDVEEEEEEEDVLATPTKALEFE